MSKWSTPVHIESPQPKNFGRNAKLDCAGQYMVDRPCPKRRCKGLLRTVALCTGRGVVLVPTMRCDTCGFVMDGFVVEVKTND